MRTPVEIIDLVPNSMSFRVITTLDVRSHEEVPAGFTGRVRCWTGTHLTWLAWYHDGALHNPGRSHPAYRRFRPTGELKYERWYQRGRLDDPATGGAAVRGFYADGTPHYEEHYLDGARHDGRRGEPAVVKWRHDGTERHRLHYRFGVRSTSG
jgi:hypothetical protein